MDRQAEETPDVVPAGPLHPLPAQVGLTPPPTPTQNLLLLLPQTADPFRCCRDLLMDTVPVARLDFTAVLPRFLSLYVMSFLNPRDLCSAARVSWHWRFLAEQVGFEKMAPTLERWVNAFPVSPSGLPVGREVYPEGMVPPLQPRNQRIRSLEEPLHRLRLRRGLAASQEGGRTFRAARPANGRGGREEGGEEAETDDQREDTGGEK